MINNNSVLVYLLLGIFVFTSSCGRSTRSFYQEGVSEELARYRARHVYDVHYDLSFTIGEQKDEPITGKVELYFKPLKARHGIILDFQPGEDFIHKVRLNGDNAIYHYMNGHIYVDADGMIPRQNNIIEIVFTSSNQALNRSDDFMYTLFVPDRASTAFPCFDQPDLKATFELSLTIPSSWTALSNGRLENELLSDGDSKQMNFAADKPISTYLFAFAAGKFEVLSQKRAGRTIHIYHRETDKEKAAKNIPVVFEQHFDALDWLEQYTGIPYPYEKFDLLILPGFQYSGMEHPGAIWYRDTRLLLDKEPSVTHKVSRANLIAHETAHMWFGNLVTMKWFDDVWLKEVFAGFMADKITEEQFKDHNHALQFVLAHYPRAYTVDRTLGTHPIKQKLSNMKMAGTLYGAIIYHKAPIIFEQLEHIMQKQNFKTAVREYLTTYAHANADWNDLVVIFDQHTHHNISQWSEAWVHGKGMPQVSYSIKSDAPDTETAIIINHDSHNHSENFPAQLLSAAFVYEDSVITHNIWVDDSTVEYPLTSEQLNACLILLNGAGMGYGLFELDASQIAFIIEQIWVLENDNLRAAAYINMHENFLIGKMDADTYFDFVLSSLNHEQNQQLQNYLVSNLATVCWNFLDYEENMLYSQRVESYLWNILLRSDASAKELFFDYWLKLSRSEKSVSTMIDIYSGQIAIENFTLSEKNRSDLVCEAVIRYNDHTVILEEELERIQNPDRLRRLQFIKPALSHDRVTRHDFFEKLMLAENRNPEPWVIDALYFLHHPVRKENGQSYVTQSLEIIEEIQETGDIFFPKNWLKATLQYYNSDDVARKVLVFMESHDNLPKNLKLKILQAADLLFRSSGKSNHAMTLAEIEN